MLPQMELFTIATITAVSCALPGTLLFLRRMSMTADAITHTVLLGIVAAYLCCGSLSSPLAMLGAAFAGLATVYLTELLLRTGLLAEESALGIVFPFLFAVAIALIHRFAATIHLDADAVLLGELAFAPLERLTPGGIDIGPRTFYVSLLVCLANLLFIFLFYKELQLAVFDATAAALFGLRPGLLLCCQMALVCITAVSAFQAAGSILVVAFMIAPPATASFFSTSLRQHLAYSCLFAVTSSVVGFRFAFWLDVSVAGSMAVAAGLCFFLCAKLAEKHAAGTRRKEQKI